MHVWTRRRTTDWRGQTTDNTMHDRLARTMDKTMDKTNHGQNNAQHMDRQCITNRQRNKQTVNKHNWQPPSMQVAS